MRIFGKIAVVAMVVAMVVGCGKPEYDVVVVGGTPGGI